MNLEEAIRDLKANIRSAIGELNSLKQVHIPSNATKDYKNGHENKIKNLEYHIRDLESTLRAYESRR